MTPRRLYEESYAVRCYSLLEQLGDGNTAIVFRARRDAAKTDVAIKFYNPLDYDDAGRPQSIELERFRREFAAVGNICHENVVRVLESSLWDTEYDTDTRSPYLVMELLDESLKDQLDANPGRYREVTPFTLALLRGIGAGLVAIHEQDVVHRDLKPANIMFRGNTPVIADFGFSLLLCGDRLTQSGEFLGTLPYASPEQLRSAGKVTEATDVYSLGVVMYELLTGDLPFPLEDGMHAEEYRQIRSTPQRICPDELPGDISPVLAELCCKCLEPTPAIRLKAREIVARLDAISRGRD